MLSLFCQGRWGRRGLLPPPALWVLLGGALLRWEPGGALLLQVPALVFFLLAGVGLAGCLGPVWGAVRQPEKGVLLYAVR